MKTTLMNLITDNVKRDSGSILWEGEDILELGGTPYVKKIIFQKILLFSKKLLTK